jgi:hypothetical protein
MKMQAALQKMGRLRLANLLLDDEELSHPWSTWKSVSKIV